MEWCYKTLPLKPQACTVKPTCTNGYLYNSRSNCRIPRHLQLVHAMYALSFFLFLEQEIDNMRLRSYAATWLRCYAAGWLRSFAALRLFGYAAMWLRGELDLCVAYLFRPTD